MKQIVKRVLFTGICILIALLLQTVVSPQIPFLTMMPNFLLIVVTTFAILRGRREGMIVGLICGLLADFTSGGLIGFYAIVYLWIGYVNGLFSRFLAPDMVLIPVVACFINEIIYGGYVYVFRYLLRNRLDILTYGKTIWMPEVIETIICAMICYGIMMVINGKLEEQQRRGERRFA